MLGLVAGIALMWIVSILQDATRNVRFILALTIWSAIWLGTSILRPDARPIVQAALAVVIAGALLRPDLLGLSSVSRREQRIDATFRTLAPISLDPLQAAQARIALADLEQKIPRASAYWHLAVHLLQRVAQRQAQPESPAGSTPTQMLHDYARRYAYIARSRHVLGRRQHPTLADEDIVLRCYLEDYLGTIPDEARLEDATVPVGSWDMESRADDR